MPKIDEMWCVTWKLYLPDGTARFHDECPMAIALKQNRPVRDIEAVSRSGRTASGSCFMPYPTPLRDERGHWLVGAVNMLVDITARKEAEQRMLLPRPPRSITVPKQPARGGSRRVLRLTKADTAEEFRTVFAGRLSALANVQRAVLGFALDRRGSATIVEEELRPYASRVRRERIRIAGDDVRLPPTLAQSIAVALQELATNAAKYGALSRPSGRPEIKLGDQWRTGLSCCTGRRAAVPRSTRAPTRRAASESARSPPSSWPCAEPLPGSGGLKDWFADCPSRKA